MIKRLTITVGLLASAAMLSACGTFSEPQVDALPADVAANAPVVSADSYVLDEGDKIAIQVFDEPDLTMNASVRASGIINYSYLGDIQVSGKTPTQLEQDITAVLEDGYLVNPSVNVTVIEYRPFFINGEVRAPGSYPYQPGLTLDKAIALAGGLTDRASRSRMTVLKPNNGQGANSAKKAQMQTRIAPGDIISIKEGFF